jgi:hypothetical protein
MPKLTSSANPIITQPRFGKMFFMDRCLEAIRKVKTGHTKKYRRPEADGYLGL